MKNKKILITGCSGFIGSNLINFLSKQRNYLIYGLARQPKHGSNNDIIYIYQDLRQPLVVNELPNDLDFIIHLAADMSKITKNPVQFQINTVSTLNLLEFGKNIGIKQFIFASTGGVYGYANQPHNEDSPINPIDFYALSKYESELLVNFYSKYFTTIILRLFFPYGPGQTKGIVPLLVNKIIKKDKIIIFNDDNPRINPIYIEDVINYINELLILRGKYIFNVVGNEVISVKELSEMIGKYIGSKPRFKYIKDNTISNMIGNNTKIRKLFDIKNLISIDQGIKEYIKNMKRDELK